MNQLSQQTAHSCSLISDVSRSLPLSLLSLFLLFVLFFLSFVSLCVCVYVCLSGSRWSFSTSLSWPIGSTLCRSSTSRKCARWACPYIVNALQSCRNGNVVWEDLRFFFNFLKKKKSAERLFTSWGLGVGVVLCQWNVLTSTVILNVCVLQEELPRQLQYISLYLCHILAAYLLKWVLTVTESHTVKVWKCCLFTLHVFRILVPRSLTLF